MGIFEQFPYSNFHNANLDNVLNNSNQALRDAANAVHIAGEAKDIAEGLADDVATALQEAEAASTAAASAEATAAQAQAEAEAVSGLAQDAYDLASAADSAAANALSVANTANSNAGTALSTANTANTNAGNAVTTANAARTTANAANTNANNAVSTANSALTAVNNIPDADTTTRGFMGIGNQIFEGIKTFLEKIVVKIKPGTDAEPPRFEIRDHNDSIAGRIRTTTQTFEGNKYPIRWVADLFSLNSSNGERTPYYEAFRLPAVDFNRSANATYDVITTKNLVSADRTLSSVVIPSGKYVSIGDAVTDFGMPSTGQLIAFFIRGWSGANLPLSLITGSNGTTLYVTGAAQTITQLKVRIWYIK